MKQIKPMILLLMLSFLIIGLAACGGGPGGAPPPPPPGNNGGGAVQSQTIANTSGALSIRGDVWVDNWFSFSLGDTFLIEDSVPITTERSFNATTFTFNADYPLVLNFIVKDFKENDTGLEYIGERNQQMGDGGFIAQFTDTASGQVIAATNADWKCLVIHKAPLDKACENESNPVAGQGPCGFTALDEPAGWTSPDFDDSAWTNASVYSEAQVGPKDGYDQISWDPAAQLIWGSDLETDNTLLCRLRVEQP